MNANTAPNVKRMSNLATALDRLLIAEGQPGIVQMVCDDDAPTWRELAVEVQRHTGVPVSHQTLANWRDEWTRDLTVSGSAA